MIRIQENHAVTEPSETFQKEVPEISLEDAAYCAKIGRLVQSFNAHPIVTDKGKIKALAVKWKLANGSTESLVIAPYAALVLRMMLSHLEDNKWTELAIIPPDAKPRQ